MRSLTTPATTLDPAKRVRLVVWILLAVIVAGGVTGYALLTASKGS